MNSDTEKTQKTSASDKPRLAAMPDARMLKL